MLTSAGEPFARLPEKTAYRFVTNDGAMPVASTSIGETIYSVDERMHKAGGWQAPPGAARGAKAAAHPEAGGGGKTGAACRARKDPRVKPWRGKG